MGNDGLRFGLEMTMKRGKLKRLFRYKRLGFDSDMRIERRGERLELSWV